PPIPAASPATSKSRSISCCESGSDAMALLNHEEREIDPQHARTAQDRHDRRADLIPQRLALTHVDQLRNRLLAEETDQSVPQLRVSGHEVRGRLRIADLDRDRDDQEAQPLRSRRVDDQVLDLMQRDRLLGDRDRRLLLRLPARTGQRRPDRLPAEEAADRQTAGQRENRKEPRCRTTGGRTTLVRTGVAVRIARHCARPVTGNVVSTRTYPHAYRSRLHAQTTPRRKCLWRRDLDEHPKTTAGWTGGTAGRNAERPAGSEAAVLAGRARGRPWGRRARRGGEQAVRVGRGPWRRGSRRRARQCSHYRPRYAPP